jgi:hypothetical protein
MPTFKSPRYISADIAIEREGGPALSRYFVGGNGRE